MAKKNDFTKRANDYLANRLGPVQRLGELLDAKAEKEAELKDCDAAIDKAVQECIEAGWKPAELADLGVPKTSIPRRQTRTATLEPRTPPSEVGDSAAGGPAPDPTQ